MYEDPVGFLFTWSTYGTWLPGDELGWVEYHKGWKYPDPVRELEAKARMTEGGVLLLPQQRAAVETQIMETCAHRGWHLHAVNCRSNHIHAVISAINASPKKIRADLKAWTTRRLKSMFDPIRNNWWSERGSIRFLFDSYSLETAVIYVNEAQDRKSRDAF